MVLDPLPAGFAASREALRAVACYAIAPARKARTGRIGLRPTGDGFGTPPFPEGDRIVVRGTQVVHEPGGEIEITTVRAVAAFLGVEPRPDPGVGSDLPTYEPDAALGVEEASSLALGAWYAFGERVLDGLAAQLPGGAELSEAQLWPEHFDFATTVTLGGRSFNVGFSPGDAFAADPYAYVGPHDLAVMADDPARWNAPFGAYLAYDELTGATDPVEAAQAFVLDHLRDR